MSQTGGLSPPFVPPTLVLGKHSGKRVLNPLEKKQYAKLGRNNAAEARPAVVHFGGFELGKRHTQIVRVVNVTPVAQRIHVLNPATPFFSARFSRAKKGWLAPGMAEEIAIDFEPAEWRYYYDCVRLHTGDETLLVPIHAYPVVNEVIFPSKLDLGVCPLAETTTKVVMLRCNVPIQFEYELTVTQPHPDIVITPLRGVIPSEGHVAVEVQFTPRALACASCELLVSVSQLNFKPFTCAITGSSVAGLTRNNMLAALQEGFDAEETSRARDEALALPAGGTLRGDVGEMSSYRGPLDVSTRPVGAGSGAVADWGGAHVAARRIKPASGKMEIILPKFRPPSPQTEVEGLQIPAHLEGPFATNFIITQQPGKLKPKDLKAAIDEQRALRKKQKEQQEALRAAQGHGEAIPGQVAFSTVVSDARGAGPPSTRQLMELVFLQDLAEIEKAEKDREFQSQNDVLGQDLLTPAQTSFAVELRERHELLARLAVRTAERAEFEPRRLGPHDPSAPVRATVRATADPVGELGAAAPRFDAFVNDVWMMRKQILQRFRLGATKIIVRRRAAGRLACVKRLLAPCANRQEVRALVEADNRAAAAAGSAHDDEPKKVHGEIVVPKWSLGGALDATAVHRPCFPAYAEGGDEGGRHAIPVTTPHDFNDIGPEKLVAPHETELVGHVAHAPLALGAFPPVEAERVTRPRRGAAHEAGVLAPRRISLEPLRDTLVKKDDGADDEAAAAAAAAAEDDGASAAAGSSVRSASGGAAEPLPDPATLAPPTWLGLPVPAEPLSLVTNGSLVRTFAEPLARTEADLDFDLRPKPRPREVTAPSKALAQRDQVGCSTLDTLASTPTIALPAWAAGSSFGAGAGASAVVQSRASGNGGGWQPRRERRCTTVWGSAARSELWAVADLPELMDRPLHTRRQFGAHQDAMSESESEDEGDDSIVVPTVAMSRTLFMALAAREVAKAAAAGSAAAGDGGDGGDSGGEAAAAMSESARSEAGSEAAEGGLAYPSSVKVAFARDERLLELERAKRVAAEVAAGALTGRLEAAAAKVQSTGNFFVTEGHGATLPCHQVQLRSERSFVPQRLAMQQAQPSDDDDGDGGAEDTTTSS
jgi:hypothetical protein